MARARNHNNNLQPTSDRSYVSTGGRLNGLRAVRSIDSDDHDETGGGVSLLDSDHDDYHTPTATGDRSHGNGDFSTPTGKSAMAPIGTGRFSEYTERADAGARLNASLDTLLEARDMGANENSEQTKADGATPMDFNTAPAIYHDRDQADMMEANHPNDLTPVGTTAYGMDLYPVPSYHGGMVHYPQGTATAPHPSFGSLPSSYNGAAGGTCATPQGVGLATPATVTLGHRFYGADQSHNLQMTPSHARKLGGGSTNTTPGLAVFYNQTEPRNFAPRTGLNPVALPPPPAFNLGLDASSARNDAAHSTTSDSDPFSSSTPTEGSTAASTLQFVANYPLPDGHQHGQGLYLSVFCRPPPEIRALRSHHLNSLTDSPTGMPTLEIALDPKNFPFIESCSQAAPAAHGVVKILNIPFGTKRCEIIAFLGRNSKMLNDNQEPVHIIMERVTSKTQDAYVEFVTMQDAMRAVERHQMTIQKGRISRLGDRPVEVQLSSQSALMKDLFPLAAGVFWDGAKPVIQGPTEGQPWKTFKGFVTEEEMTMLVKHVEIPQRSPYSKECPQRPYECMISTIKKLPWYMSSHITLRQRHAVYNATERLVMLLVQTLQLDNLPQHETTVNEQLLKRLVTAAMLCPGFSVVQKDNIALMARLDEGRARAFNQPRFADMWTHLHALCPRPGIPLDVLEWYIAVVREDTARCVARRPLNEQADIAARGAQTCLYFGYMWAELNLPSGPAFDSLTLHELARRELAALERALRRACAVRY